MESDHAIKIVRFPNDGTRVDHDDLLYRIISIHMNASVEMELANRKIPYDFVTADSPLWNENGSLLFEYYAKLHEENCGDQSILNKLESPEGQKEVIGLFPNIRKIADQFTHSEEMKYDVAKNIGLQISDRILQNHYEAQELPAQQFFIYLESVDISLKLEDFPDIKMYAYFNISLTVVSDEDYLPMVSSYIREINESRKERKTLIEEYEEQIFE